MKTFPFLICLSLVLSFVSEVDAQKYRKIRTIEEVYSVYPQRVDGLLQSLDLERDGLQKVKKAVGEQDAVAACKELLDYFRTAKTARYLRRPEPSLSDRIDSYADSMLQDIFRFYELADRVPRMPNGQLDWAHKGPDNDIEWAWGLNRHGHLDLFLQAYHDTGNPAYARAIDNHLQDWIVGSLPYPGVKSSTAQWRGLEVALRAKNWVRVFFGLADSDYLTPATKIMMLTSIPDHTHYMENFHAKAGNWLTMEMSGLAMVATAWPEFKRSRNWVAYAKSNMLEGLKDQVYPDGVQKELTSHYHQVALLNFDHFREICDQAGEPLPEDYKRELEKMHHYVAATVKPTGYGIMNNDSDSRYNRELIADAAGRYQREDWLFISSNGKKGKRPEGPPSVVFPWAGQLVNRSGYDGDSHWGFFDIGPWGTGHQHNDKLHLSVTAYGRDLLVDGGRFAYRGQLADKFRAYATGSESHNVLLIDGAGQDAGPTTASQPLTQNSYKITDQFDYASGSFDKFKGLTGAAKHSRAVFYMRGKFWVVIDRIDTDRPRKVQALWHWHPDLEPSIKPDGIVTTSEEKGNLQIIPVGKTEWNIRSVKGQEQPSPQGWYSEKYNLSEPAIASIYSTAIAGSSSFVWILQPSEKIPSPLKAEILSHDKDKIKLRIADEKLNAWEVVVPFADSELASYVFTSSAGRLLETPGGEYHVDQTKKLLSHLDLDLRGMEEVKSLRYDPARAAAALLKYYRSRQHVKHAIDRHAKARSLGKAAGEDDIKEADQALQHIFVGQGAYPPHYCGDDIDWASRPVPDNEWVWQLNRMRFWDAMAKAYWHTGDEKYAREWGLQLLDWTQKNPRDEQHAYAWRSIEAGIRGYNWTGLFQRFIDSPAFTPAVLVAFLNSCHDHASFLMTKYRKGSNWALMEAEGMAFIAMTFPEFKDAEAWRKEGITRLNIEIENQVYPDGHQRELAIGYHTGSIGWFKRTLDMATLNGLEAAFPQSYRDVIERMCEVPFKLGLPDGSTTQFGDSWAGEPGRIWPMLREWAKVFDRNDFLYVASEGREGKQPDATAFALEKSGLYSMRSGWDKNAICLVLKCGPDGGGHCQPDNGTFELYAGGRHLMPDGGSYIYSGNPEGRAWFRQTRVHQTLTLNGANSRYAPSQLLWKPGEDLDVLVVENASYQDLSHRRAVLFVDKKYFVIIDEALGSGTGDVDIHFQLGPGPAVFDSTALTVRSDFQDGWNVLVQATPQRNLRLSEEEGWVSFVYTQKERRPAFRFHLQKSSAAGVRFITIVAPYEGKRRPRISAEILGKPEVGSSRVGLRLIADGKARKVYYDLMK